jgi:hypothetical protein
LHGGCEGLRTEGSPNTRSYNYYRFGTDRFSWTARDDDVGPPSCTCDIGRMGREGPRAT